MEQKMNRNSSGTQVIGWEDLSGLFVKQFLNKKLTYPMPLKCTDFFYVNN